MQKWSCPCTPLPRARGPTSLPGGAHLQCSCGNRYSALREIGTERRETGTPIGVEIKASPTVTASDARHLAWLRDEPGGEFAARIVLHAGPHVFPVSDRIIAAPVSALWSQPALSPANASSQAARSSRPLPGLGRIHDPKLESPLMTTVGFSIGERASE
jgi:hypothetical protein